MHSMHFYCKLNIVVAYLFDRLCVYLFVWDCGIRVRCCCMWPCNVIKFLNCWVLKLESIIIAIIIIVKYSSSCWSLLLRYFFFIFHFFNSFIHSFIAVICRFCGVLSLCIHFDFSYHTHGRHTHTVLINTTFCSFFASLLFLLLPIADCRFFSFIFFTFCVLSNEIRQTLCLYVIKFNRPLHFMTGLRIVQCINLGTVSRVSECSTQ